MQENIHLDPSEQTGVMLTLILILNSFAHLFEYLQPLLASLAALAGLMVALMSIVINGNKFFKAIKEWFKIKK